MTSWPTLRWHLAWAATLAVAAGFGWFFLVTGLYLLGVLAAIVGEWQTLGIAAVFAVVWCWGLSRYGTRAVPVLFPAVYAAGLTLLAPAGEWETVGIGLAAAAGFAAICLRPQILLAPAGPARTGGIVEPVRAVTPTGVTPTRADQPADQGRRASR